MSTIHMTTGMPKCQWLSVANQSYHMGLSNEPSRENEGLSLEIERETLENTRLSVNSARQRERENKTTFCAPCWDDVVL
mgnify:CR=1 FL=1